MKQQLIRSSMIGSYKTYKRAFEELIKLKLGFISYSIGEKRNAIEFCDCTANQQNTNMKATWFVMFFTLMALTECKPSKTFISYFCYI